MVVSIQMLCTEVLGYLPSSSRIKFEMIADLKPSERADLHQAAPCIVAVSIP